MHTQAVHWDLHYTIALGATWGRFMRGLQDGQLWATRCPDCDRTYLPATSFCEECFLPLTDWVELPAIGALELFTVVRQGFAGGPPVPYAIGAIRVDGASTLLFHRLTGFDLGDGGVELRSGVRVRAHWELERSGSILDIASFVPVES